MKRFALVLALFVIAGFAQISNAQTVKGGGSAAIRSVTVCKWSEAGCLTDIIVVNTSNRFGITKVILDIPEFSAIETWIPPLGEKRFSIPVTIHPGQDGDAATLEQIKTTAVIRTARKPK